MLDLSAQKPTNEKSQQHEGRKAVKHFTASTRAQPFGVCVISSALSLMGEVNASAQGAQLSAQTHHFSQITDSRRWCRP